MESLLYKIYQGEYDVTLKWDEKESRISDEIHSMLEQIKAKFGREFVDQLTNLYIEQRTMLDYRYYRAGFCLGVRLMLEGLTGATG